MKTCKGKSVLDGISIGKIKLLGKQEYIPKLKKIDDIDSELYRFRAAIKEADQQLGKLYEEILQSLGKDEAGIIEVQRLMLQDEGFIEDIEKGIQQKRDAEYTVYEIGKNYSETFRQMDDAYMKARSVDVLDISARIIRILANIEEEELNSQEKYILLADDLTPSETVQLDKEKVLAFVTVNGSTNSHTAILARSLNLPSLVMTNIEIKNEYNGKWGIVNGFTGEFMIDPDKKTLAEAEKNRITWMNERESLKAFIGKENITSDGRKVDVFCNIGNASDLKYAIEQDAGGIGLFRSEFLYLGKDSYPSEEEQFENYKIVAEGMKGKKVVIRTLDIGADKKADYFNLEKEENPALGYRAIRICLSKPEIFKTQLRAIYRASAFGTVAIMFPMIISVEEIREIKEIVKEVKKELDEKQQVYKDVELGIMIETPAAALVAEELAKEVDFFSIGTNDLTQYTLAIDRQNQNLEKFYNAHHPAVIRLIQMTVEAAHKNNIWVGICGELAGDLELTKTFIDMGVDELSVSASKILQLRRKICRI